ncbi:PREDICTED: ras GTPase-activating protein-binding protein 2 isoform X2 [Brassica oleracea var. oleracea]|uniref:ras GTPase-activating protein-binding protein 2 isoform X2 n=1 Tax=Brassica oleracea var. oleracea TaxID=109376 RepID=UPI0006A6F6D4|nr:PREDICTED: ras GTPase-activating protein-binding protein 2 isoform X2 [Brassica oleracea var. oleracea]
MALESNAPLADPHIVGNAFVKKYYNHLYESPSQVHRFYLEDSVLGRPGSDGEMAINEQIMSFDYENSKIQILTADSQASYMSGVVTLVTGLLTVNDGERMRFSQSFFLVPQKGSYFVLNDVFRYVSDELVVEPEANKKEVEEEVTPQAVQTTTDTIISITMSNGHPITEEEKVVNDIISNGVDAPKKSFAVIVQSPAKVGAAFNVKASTAKPKPVKKLSAALESKAPAPVSQIDNQSAEGGSIFVANLPMDATPEQLNETFKGFGAIKNDAIQVRSYRLKGNCFGFVTFESAEAVKLVLQAHKESAIRIGNRRVSIEEKRGNNENGRSSTRNGGYRSENGYRNDGFRPRGNGFNGGGRGHGGNGYERRGESRNAEANNNGDGSRAYQNGLVKSSRENAQARG